MSGSIDQRSKGPSNPVSNGPSSKGGDFDYMQAPTQGYGSAPMSSPNVSDPYYYPQYMFPNPNPSGLNDGTSWSTGGDPMSFLGGYPGQMGSDYMSSNMFGFDYSQPNFGWGYSGGDYNSTWGTPGSQAAPVRKTDERGYTDGYSYMGQEYMNGDVTERDAGVKAAEHSLKSMNLNERQDARETRQTSGGGASSGGSGGSSAAQRTWASIAKQPARPQPQKTKGMIPRPPVLPNRPNMDIGTWDNKNSANRAAGQATRQAWGAARPIRNTSGPYGLPGAGSSPTAPAHSGTPPSSSVNNVIPASISNNGSVIMSSASNGTAGLLSGVNPSMAAGIHPVLDKLRAANHYNPKNFNMAPDGVRFFIIKSYSEDDIHRSIKYGIWCSTEHGNKRLDTAYREREGKGPVYLLFSVNGSGHFCGMAQMMSPVDYNAQAGVWAQDKWKGQFEVKWIYVKDIPNSQLRHIRLENNENKPVTNSRDTQEVPPEKGKQVLRIMHQYRHTTSIFDDFCHYEKRQEADAPPEDTHGPGPSGRGERNGRDHGDRDRGDRGERGDRRDRGDHGDRGGDRGDRNDRGGDRGNDRGDRGNRRPRNPQH